MLSIFISLPLVALEAWLLRKIVALFRRGSAGRVWWIAMAVIIPAGGIAGYRLARLDLRMSETFRWVGVPMPIGFFQLEEGRWTDFIPPFPVQLLNLLVDVLIPIMVLLVVLLLTWRLGHRGAQTASGAKPA